MQSRNGQCSDENTTCGQQSHGKSIEIYGVLGIEIGYKGLMYIQEHPNANVRSATIWTIINLTWPGDDTDHHELAQQRIAKLKTMGVEEKLVQEYWHSNLCLSYND